MQAVLSELVIALGGIVAELDDQWNDSWQVLAEAVSNRPTAQTDMCLRISVARYSSSKRDRTAAEYSVISHQPSSVSAAQDGRVPITQNEAAAASLT